MKHPLDFNYLNGHYLKENSNDPTVSLTKVV